MKIMRFLPIFTLLMCGSISCIAQTQQEKPSSNISQMRQIYVQDQRDRGVLLSDAGQQIKPTANIKPPQQLDGATRMKRDAARRQQVRVLLKAGEVTTAQDFHDAAFIFQHGDSPNDYLLAHILAVEAIVRGDASSKWISASTLDRYLHSIGKPQIFGTQYLSHDFLYIQQHKNDSTAMSKFKPQPGMTQQPYNELLIPDSLRLDYCVPNLMQQKKNLEEFEQGKYPEEIMPAGCTR